MTPRQKFESAVKHLVSQTFLETKEATYYAALFNGIKKKIRQFNFPDYQIYEVINETYLRGIKLIESGQEIENPGAWIRVTSFNVIREMSREQKKEQLWDSNLIEDQLGLEDSHSLSSSNSEDEDLRLLELALKKLDPKDSKLIVLREIEGLSWRQVVNHLASKGEYITEASARQRGNRALKRLRNRFFELKADHQ
ncbi:MAG: sigma-70 family RNA polymerase sigma factor [Moorea sp. SIO3I7]|uniref:RNA polymerase sigma factor n=1 Tax=unclassified Moorena TaxID=2683338 RepID=UPI0013C25193|nr:MULTISPECIES: sigma-70 family RNA polymerase sigma factor [unclassified Moorena]NEN95299.1 sigma-70 family RNA polymerase sigma factor [Moorena sp. SIO3I7]NEO04094.1 sigma-70 family RNA polymerase sigma factor [Moorena sp. SIO3I8]NEO20733.1 sigma-70 family RNA polymerase sigma factor [Moorena sp. SIO4A5]NEQ61407.1 sigma-70 family RNA polymerase sigma factor [Moorena sp. SIO4A1]